MAIPWTVWLNWFCIFALASGGAILCGSYARNRSSVGFGLIALFFGMHALQVVVNAVLQTIYLTSFEVRQIDSSTWTAPVLNVDTGLPVTLTILLVACYRIAQKVPVTVSTRRDETISAKPVRAGKLEAGI